MDPEGSQNINEAGQAPVLEPGHTLATVTDKISSIVWAAERAKAGCSALPSPLPS